MTNIVAWSALKYDFISVLGHVSIVSFRWQVLWPQSSGHAIHKNRYQVWFAGYMDNGPHYAKLSQAMPDPWMDRFVNSKIYCYPLSKKRCGPPVATPLACLVGGHHNLRPQQRNVYMIGDTIIVLYSIPYRGAGGEICPLFEWAAPLALERGSMCPLKI